jgi:phage gp16-like protein
VTAGARPAGGRRRAALAKIHIAKQRLALCDASYRDLLRRVAGVESAAALDQRGIDRVLAEFRRLGFADGRRRYPARPQARMIRAVWADIVRLGIDAADPEAALGAFIRRQTVTPASPAGVDDVQFLDSRQANRVLEGLKAWRARLEARDAGAA